MIPRLARNVADRVRLWWLYLRYPHLRTPESFVAWVYEQRALETNVERRRAMDVIIWEVREHDRQF